jgi:lipopolysaccharide export system permease protein
MALPLAILLSSIMLLGDMGENNELLAFKSAGVSLLRIISPLIVLTIFISISAFFFSNNVLPYTTLKMRSLLSDIQHTKPEINIQSGVFLSNIKDYRIKVGRKSSDGKMLYDMMIYDHTKGKGNESVLVADSGKVYITEDKKHMAFVLYSGADYQELNAKNSNEIFPVQKHSFSKEKILFEIEGFGLKRSDDALWKDYFKMLNIKQLDYMIDSLGKNLTEQKKNITTTLLFNNYFKREIKIDSLMYHSKKIYHLNTDSLYQSLDDLQKLNSLNLAVNFARSSKTYFEFSNESLISNKKWYDLYGIEWHRKYTLSFACFILFFIGAPLGAIIRKGGLGMPVVVSIIFFLLYYVISITGEKLARESTITPFFGMWISSFFFFPIGVFLTYKASRDSVILNITSYLEPLKKFIKKKK